MDSMQQNIADRAGELSAQAAKVSAEAAEVAAKAQFKADKQESKKKPPMPKRRLRPISTQPRRALPTNLPMRKTLCQTNCRMPRILSQTRLTISKRKLHLCLTKSNQGLQARSIRLLTLHPISLTNSIRFSLIS